MILAYLALAIWIIFCLIGALMFLGITIAGISAGSGGAIVYGLIGLAINGFIVYLAYSNIKEISECARNMPVTN